MKSSLWRPVVAALSAGLVPVTPAAGHAVTRQHARQYSRAYRQVARKFGRRAPGRNILRWGLANHRRPSDARLLVSLGVLQRDLAPPPVAVVRVAAPVASDSTVQSAPVLSSSSGGSGGLPYCTWGPESGGNWSAVNPSSGAGGKYQILPSTWASNGGTGLPQDASPSEQTRIATKIYAGGAGASQWVNC